ncbi:MAG: RNA 3'-terminal phosphate cyclase [Methanobacteriaceae archaeon]|nr:RNA 3'-terminal phosphate cyclase [Methanobacteriaceae archaeon]
MIAIDGSYGEGGGAIIRTATALSALTGKPIHITNIRANRPKKGLAPQHLTAIKALSSLTSASCSGLKLGSREIYFKPGPISGGNYHIDIKTAGSTTLVLQSLMIPSMFADSTVNLVIKGGTDVKWSPTFDYLKNVTLPFLRVLGYMARIDLIKRGFYPRGGGIIKAKINPIKRLKPINLTKLEISGFNGISHCSKLPCHVATRQAQKATEILEKKGYPVEIDVQCIDNSISPGSAIVLWTRGNYPLGGSDIGEPGKRAETVAKNAADELLDQISKNSPLDKYMGDQIIPYMAITGRSSIKTAELTKHTVTNIYVAEKIMDKKFKVEGKIGEPAIISIE